MISYSLPPLYEGRNRKHFLLLIFVILLFSLISRNYFVLGDNVRLSGMFTNPNNFSLMSFSLLFFINEEKEIFFKIFLYIFIAIILITTSTLGAIIAFFLSFLYKYRMKPHRLLVIFMIVLSFVLAKQMFSSKPSQLHNRLVNQFKVIEHNLPEIYRNDDIDFGQLANIYGEENISGIYRLKLWTDVVHVLMDQKLGNLIIGNGIGSSLKLLSNLPHNEYLRVMLELGIVGFLLNAILCFIIYFRMSRNYRYIFVLLALFSLTENIFDNFLFMSIFIFFITTVRTLKVEQSANIH